MYKIGLKLWSTNTDCADDVNRIFKQGYFQYIELFSVPNTFTETIDTWRAINIPYVIHAPHSMKGLNFAKSELWSTNEKLADESFRFADILNADKVIFHTGLDGKLEETIRQVLRINDSRMVLENKPYYGINNEICLGSTPSEMSQLINETKKRFCFDLGHAICAANAKKADPQNYIKSFLNLNPCMYHLTDGDYKGSYDRHDHYGDGSYPLKELLAFIPEESMITNEAKRDDDFKFDGFIKDTNYINGLSQK